jgi:hypothetical protein
MIKQYRYRLETYNPETGKHTCPNPNCQHKTFVYYVDTYQDNRPVYPTVGRCERINECGYSLTPWDFFKDNSIDKEDLLTPSGFNFPVTQPETQKKFNIIKPDHLKASMINRANTFTKFLLRYLDKNYETLDKLLQLYCLGSYGDGVIYWQVDQNQKIRTGKIMYYDSQGHRFKDVIKWYHSKFKSYQLKQCLYGLHLLTPDTRIVYIVESEKTAILLKHYYVDRPEIVVMSTGGIYNLTPDKFKVFKNFNVQIICLPDIKAEAIWQINIEKMKSLNINISLINSNRYIEKFFTPEGYNPRYRLTDGQDIADYFIYLRFGFSYVNA